MVSLLKMVSHPSTAVLRTVSVPLASPITLGLGESIFFYYTTSYLYSATSSSQSSKYKMRKCISCGQWMGHVLCLKGQPEQCADCVVVPLERPKPSPPTTTQYRRPAQCTCAVCVAKYSLNVGGEHNSRESKSLTVSIPRRLIKLSLKSLTVSIPLKRLQYKQQKELKVAISRSPLQFLSGREVKSQASVHPVIKALSRQYPKVKVLSLIPLPLYTPHQLLHLHQPRGSPSQIPEKVVELRQPLESGSAVELRQPLESGSVVELRQPLESGSAVKLRQPLQSEVENKVEMIEPETKKRLDEEIEPREVYADSPLLQILYDYTVGDKSKS